jgi:hypothetical protein
MRCVRLIARLVLVVGVCASAAACTSKYSPLYVQGPSGQPHAAWRDCKSRDGITDISLYSGTPRDTTHLVPIWSVHAVGTAQAQTVVIGVTPDGFQADIPLAQGLQPGTTYTLQANYLSKKFVSGFVVFKPAELGTGVVVFANDIVDSLTHYAKRSNRNFGC